MGRGTSHQADVKSLVCFTPVWLIEVSQSEKEQDGYGIARGFPTWTNIQRPERDLLRVAVLGPPEVFHDGSRLTFSLRKAQALLLYLAVEGGMHSRSKLAALLWPDSEPQDARKILRNAITLLRHLLDASDSSASLHSHLLIHG